MSSMGVFWRQFKVLTWKNNILRRRNYCTFVWEVLIPVALTCVMLIIYGTIRPEYIPTSIPGMGLSTRFDTWVKNNIEPVCTFYDATMLWRCDHVHCRADKCSPLAIAVAPEDAKDAGQVALAKGFLTVLGGTHEKLRTRYFESQGDLESYVREPEYSWDASKYDNLGAAVVFTGKAPAYSYELRFNHTVNAGFNYNLPPSTLKTDPLLRNPFDKSDSACRHRCFGSFQWMYASTGALALQNAVESYLLSDAAGHDVKLYNEAIDFPAVAYRKTGFWGSVAQFYGIFLVLSILYPVSNIVRSLVMEKELKIREGMKMMSLKDSALFFSWYFHFGTTFFLIAILIVVIGANTLFLYSSKLLIFIYYLLFFLATTSFMFFMSTFFSRSKTAAILGILPYFAGYFITFAVKRETARGLKLLACLHPSAAFTIAVSSLTEYEDAGIGLTGFTWSTSATSDFAFSDALGMLFLDIFIFTFLYWYNDKVWPSEFGTRLPPYFLCTRSYWNKVFPPKAPEVSHDVEAVLAVEQGADVEPVPVTLSQQIKEGKCVVIRGLSKSFETGDGVKQAVDNLNLTMYNGQITALLGHNGAGKSTTIGMLTGLIPPTQGLAMVEGHNITSDMQAIRQRLGVCPQHDVLFNDLTVEEHLTLFASFKGVEASRLAGVVSEMIKEVGLTEKRKEQAKKLSGGMKRKLSVGIAFIGDSSIVFLDEPTSGMDPYSRRFTWNVIRKYRENRIIVLTTHFMDEADLLGDRIVIMAKGGLRCCGSSLFLKNHFGVGYNMTIEKTSTADPEKIKEFVIKRIPEALVLSDVGSELSFQLPMSASSTFKAMFEDLDNSKQRLGVETYGISVTTLEEVFLRVARGEVTDQKEKAMMRTTRRHRDQEDLESSLTKEEPVQEKASGETDVDYHDHWRFFRRHMHALLTKRALYFRRDKKAWFYQFGFPGLFVLIGVVLVKLGNQSIFGQVLPPLELELAGQYNLGIQTMSCPLAYNEDGYFGWTDIDDGSFKYEFNNALTGQHQLMDNIPQGASLPVYPVELPSAYNMSLHLLSTMNKYKASRYGAFTFEKIDPATGTFQFNTHVNFTGAHAGPIFANVMANAILKSYKPGGSIKASFNPLPPTQQMMSQSASFDAFPMVIMIMLAFAFIPAAFAVFVVRERETKAKHLQIVSGVSFLSYWLSTWMFDFLSYQIPLWVTYIILKAFNVEALTEGKAGGVVIILLELFGLSVTGFTYFTSFFFKNHSQAQVITIMINFIFGLLLMIVTVMMSFLDSTKDVASKLVYVFRLVPAYALGNGLLNTGYVSFFRLIYNKPYTVTSMDMSGWPIVYMAVEAVVFFGLTLWMEWAIHRPALTRLISTTKTTLPDIDERLKDDDVVKEEKRVSAGGTEDVVIMNEMKKMYPGGKVAVKGISLGLPKGECFGLLGINGAGKTTTLSILTAEFPASSGQVFLGGYEISEHPEVVRRLVGYCPQFDALFDLMTGREHLELYARIKGLSEEEVKEVVNKMIKEMDLTEFANRNATTYSGGNKRKLSVAMAMVGKPQIIFLDEPSTGMDPVARRFMWQVISDITHRRSECCVILTTHSMEECEALCTRIGIMVGGRLRCLGSAQRLKSRYGTGYQAEFSVRLPEDADLEAFLKPLNQMSQGRLSIEMLSGALEAIKKPLTWVDRITAKGNGSDVWHCVKEGGTIRVREFASWCKLEERVDALIAFVGSQFPGAKLKERQGAKIRYEIPPKNPSDKEWRLSSIFGLVEENRRRLCIEDYCISQTSLEQLFNEFARQQEEETALAAGLISSTNTTPETSPSANTTNLSSVVVADPEG